VKLTLQLVCSPFFLLCDLEEFRYSNDLPSGQTALFDSSFIPFITMLSDFIDKNQLIKPSFGLLTTNFVHPRKPLAHKIVKSIFDDRDYINF